MLQQYAHDCTYMMAFCLTPSLPLGTYLKLNTYSFSLIHQAWRRDKWLPNPAVPHRQKRKQMWAEVTFSTAEPSTIQTSCSANHGSNLHDEVLYTHLQPESYVMALHAACVHRQQGSFPDGRCTNTHYTEPLQPVRLQTPASACGDTSLQFLYVYMYI